MSTLNLDKILASSIDGRMKGFPGIQQEIRLDKVASKNWNVLRQDLPFPVAVLKDSALKHNSMQMRNFLSVSGAELCPHGKSTMSPQLFERQMNDGAWGLTAATGTHINVYRRAGAKRIFLANQVVDKTTIEYIFEELRQDSEFEFFCLVDSVRQIDMMKRILEKTAVGRPVHLLIEIGAEGGRCGVRKFHQGLELARYINSLDGFFDLSGIEAFEGSIPGSTEEVSSAINAFLQRVVELAEACDKENLFNGKYCLLTAGGSTYFNRVADAFRSAHLSRRHTILLRSGCYLTHDHGIYADLAGDEKERSRTAYPALVPALEVWACVQSVPESGLAILSLGKRDISHDIHLPLPLFCLHDGSIRDVKIGEFVIYALNDQHAYMRCTPGKEPEIGDLIGLGISHPCTTFDKWQLLFLVDDEYNVLEGIRTFF